MVANMRGGVAKCIGNLVLRIAQFLSYSELPLRNYKLISLAIYKGN